ncbi:ComEA family DNA-binding protein [Alteromonas confluentis]|uniref:Helix-hairpin-helix DNA-binding motif class 1 domain-containing protein n=1 Tax=Alteromonas confluentis TaxID=1656094 RepID=A0A1E7Z6K6_9ALTE|nr:helix-hairpin-helix domain-containing protein [Alteromonas confluentis]OFC69024.1 hypothetical protein BFC18_19995 [Alteromonas confluentis]
MYNRKLATAVALATLIFGSSMASAEVIESSASEMAGITAADAMDLNMVTVEELMTLPGIGKSKAQAIIAYRTEKGYFHEVDQLTEVRGIGEKLLEKMRHKVKVVPK